MRFIQPFVEHTVEACESSSARLERCHKLISLQSFP
jgi:hypothetical protein